MLVVFKFIKIISQYSYFLPPSKYFIMCVLICVQMYSRSIWKISMIYGDYYLKGHVLKRPNRNYFCT